MIQSYTCLCKCFLLKNEVLKCYNFLRSLYVLSIHFNVTFVTHFVATEMHSGKQQHQIDSDKIW